jgi:hypothetical protein
VLCFDVASCRNEGGEGISSFEAQGTGRILSWAITHRAVRCAR